MMSTSRALEILHMDLFGPTIYMSIGGNKYGFIIVDDFTRFTWLLFLNEKSEVFNIFKNFIKRSENEFELKIKKVRSVMEVSLGTQKLISYMMIKALSMSFWPSILHNQMTLLRGRIEYSLIWQGQC
jgi:hypothetical protein